MPTPTNVLVLLAFQVFLVPEGVPGSVPNGRKHKKLAFDRLPHATLGIAYRMGVQPPLLQLVRASFAPFSLLLYLWPLGCGRLSLAIGVT